MRQKPNFGGFDAVYVFLFSSSLITLTDSAFKNQNALDFMNTFRRIVFIIAEMMYTSHAYLCKPARWHNGKCFFVAIWSISFSRPQFRIVFFFINLNQCISGRKKMKSNGIKFGHDIVLFPWLDVNLSSQMYVILFIHGTSELDL